LDAVFINAYWWSVDALSHHYGPYSSAVINEIKMLDLFLKELIKVIDKDTLLIITADHGQIESIPNTVLDIVKNGSFQKHTSSHYRCKSTVIYIQTGN